MKTPGQRIDQVLAEMSVLAEASAAKLGREEGHRHAESTPPPGAFDERADDPPAFAAREMVERLAQTMELELARIRGGNSENPDHRLLFKVRTEDRLDKNRRIFLWFEQGNSDRWIAYVEDIPEKVVRDLRQHGRERWER